MFFTLKWESEKLTLLDQTKLPTSLEYLEITSVDDLIVAIKKLAVRGAPALGAAGAYGVAIALLEQKQKNWNQTQTLEKINELRNARPTAVNLAWGVDQVAPLIENGFADVLAKAEEIAAADSQANRQMAKLAADWIEQKVTKRPIRALTHCNTGTLATTDWGTALGVIRELFDRKVLSEVFADETRPLLQGARLTAWELSQYGIPHYVLADGAAASTIVRGEVDVVLIGADRIAANGDSANKIGSFPLALAAKRAGIPFLVIAPESTIDRDCATGEEIEIEMRDGDEVLELQGIRIAPKASRGYNPAFDVTPHDLISAVVSEKRVYEGAKII
ncbi:MAG: S-methyl-5-thioribose-1-phosphate isomerase [Candidatus Nanopelagicales bacterium]